MPLAIVSPNHGNRVRRDYMERVGEITDLRRADEEAQRAAERAVLPRKAPAGASVAPQASIGLDHSPILAAIEHVDTLHRKLQGLKGVASVDINHRHQHEGEPGGRPGRLRTSLNGGYASDGRAWT